MSRYQSRSEVDFDRYDDRRSINFRRGSGAPPTRERESIIIKERDSDSRTPAFLRDDYGETTAGAMVLRARDREDVTYAPPRRRRSPSPEKIEREEIIIRRDEREEPRAPPPRRPPPREPSVEREEIIIRRNERSEPPAPRRPPPPRERSVEREEIIIRRDERSESGPPARARPRERSREREEIIIRRDERSQSRGPTPRYRPQEESRDREEIIIRRDEIDDRESYAAPRRATTAPIRDEREREEIIIRRDERDTRSRYDDDMISHRSFRPPPPPIRNDLDREEIIIRRDHIDSDARSRAPPPPRSRYEDEMALTRPISHERSRGRSDSASEDEIIIRRDQRDGRGRESSRQEIIIRRTSISRSPSPTASVSTRAPPAPQPAPQAQVIYAPQIHQEVITHHRHVDHGYEVRQPRYENVYSRPPSPPSPPPPAPVSVRAPPSVRDQSEERIEIRRSDNRNGRRETEDIVISRNERSQSVGPPARTREREDFYEEIDYSSSRRPRPMPEPEPEPEPEPAPPTIGSRFGARRDPTAGLWTELTKDLVVKEAIREMGYEYEETDDFYYIFKYMDYGDVARLVGLSEDIRKQRHKRLNEIRWENNVSPRPAIEPASPRAPLAIEGPPPRSRYDDRGYDREEERYIEREVVYRGGRPPPPPGWRR